MTKLLSLFTRFYDKCILSRPGPIIFCLVAVICFLGYKAKDFKLDASADTLIIKTDVDYKYSRLIQSRYGGHEYLLITYRPKGDLFSDETLSNLRRLRDELKQLERVSTVASILDAPLLESPRVPAKDLITGIQTLDSPTVDRELAKQEFRNSPLYQNLLVSPDLKTTALQITFKPDKDYEDLSVRFNGFAEKESAKTITAAERAEFKKAEKELEKYREKRKEIRHQDISAIRIIMDDYRSDAELFLGGISMVADDLISFIKKDLKIFGFGVFFLLVVTLSVIFRKIRWILLPLFCCAFSAISMMGLLGIFGWRVTVVSSNFISLQLIITMAITIHLTVRYHELFISNPETEQRQLILETVRVMITPCLYAAMTTIAGFGSLLLCDILPVKTFGWMMAAGIIVSLILTFLLFPTGLMLLNKESPKVRQRSHFSITPMLAKITESHRTLILVLSAFIFIISAIGISRLVVENSFIDYFKQSTEIYQGMKVIDLHLGGTSPLDIILEIDESESAISTPAMPADTESDEGFDAFDEFDEAQDDPKYWFTSDKMALIVKIHDYLESLPESGKVLSLGTMVKIAEKLNNGRPLDNFQLALLYSELPDQFRSLVLDPYVSPEHNQVRFTIRVKDTLKTLNRNDFLKKVHHDLIKKLGLKQERVHLTGLLVLYNNMLQSLFKSQILTLGTVVAVLIGMFLVLFKSLKIALIAIVPNLLAICTILGIMGWFNIPLDMMTITIAAISIGIAVDNTIHYIYRFKHEYKLDHNYIQTVHRCHKTIGRALYYTSLTIIIGFSILVLSNFIPSIYFGLLTGLAMLIALLGALTLLPALIVVTQPFGPNNTGKTS
jgi:predicted RND superfamily exporter protein